MFLQTDAGVRSTSLDICPDHRLARAKLTLKKMSKRDTHRPAPVRIPTFKSKKLEYAIKSYDWNLLEDPSEDYDLFSKGLLKCASSSCEATSPSASRLNAHAIKLLGQRRAVKLDPNASHLEKVTTSKACRIAVKESILAYRRLKLLEAAGKASSIKCSKRDLCDQKPIMSALMDTDEQRKRLEERWKPSFKNSTQICFDLPSLSRNA
ncbi:unnamed protein product [Heligmosomoides polygyrus]|uniref:40S ribosomal protein S19-binding protein 1 n=1 Tax=Heligmosomoides polygyrus TaxID=6339 RepID=A0A183G7T0_HELPZ|nr:unnamed protein product [Heligmosomoides polygyrus]